MTAKRLVSDESWAVVEPLLPAEPAKPKRSALEGIVYVLRSGIPWRMVPRDIGCSGVTCWRRLRRASLDSASVPAKKGDRRPAPTL